MPPAKTARRSRLVGADALLRALDDGAPVRFVLLLRGAGPAAVGAAERARASGTTVRVVASREIDRMVGGGGAAEVFACAGPDPAAPLDLAMRADGAAWLLVGLAYPGNIGSAIRTAEVSGAALVAVDPPLVGEALRGALRASIRADRFLPVFWTDARTVWTAARAAGRRVIALEASGDRAPWDVDLRGPVLLVVGGERAGVPDDLLASADAVVRLPTPGVIPSYNVQAALAAVAAERIRQEST